MWPVRLPRHRPGQPGHGPNLRLTYKVAGKRSTEADFVRAQAEGLFPERTAFRAKTPRDRLAFLRCAGQPNDPHEPKRSIFPACGIEPEEGGCGSNLWLCLIEAQSARDAELEHRKQPPLSDAKEAKARRSAQFDALLAFALVGSASSATIPRSTSILLAYGCHQNG
jgi:hypothetical protein